MAAVETAETASLRDHLANERTHLAWLRTAANVMVLGLAIARFGDGGSMSTSSLVAGSVLVATGIGGVVYGSARYRSTARDYAAGRPNHVSTTGPLVAAGVLVVALLLAVVIELL